MYTSLFKTIKVYWRDYGGHREFFASPFLHLAIFLSFFYYIDAVEVDWRSLALQALPTILGFSIAAYTITFSLMGSALHRSLSSKIDQRQKIPLISIVNSTFFHVVFVQISALMFAILSKGHLFPRLYRKLSLREDAVNWVIYYTANAGDVFGFMITIYSILLLLSVSLAMFRLGRMAPRHEAESINPHMPAANDELTVNETKKAILKTRRFKFVAWLSRRLGLYD